MAATYTPIASITLGAAVSSVTFSSIPSTYTDLVMTVETISSTTNYPYVVLNGDTGTNYSKTWLTGTGSAASSGRDTSTAISYITANAASTTSSGFISIVHFMNYSNSTTNKTFLSRSNNAGSGVDLQVNLWRNTSAITSVQILANTGTFSAGSTFNLYGIQAGNA
jgi:hypothetical protein